MLSIKCIYRLWLVWNNSYSVTISRNIFKIEGNYKFIEIIGENQKQKRRKYVLAIAVTETFTQYFILTEVRNLIVVFKKSIIYYCEFEFNTKYSLVSAIVRKWKK